MLWKPETPTQLPSDAAQYDRCNRLRLWDSLVLLLPVRLLQWFILSVQSTFCFTYGICSYPSEYSQECHMLLENIIVHHLRVRDCRNATGIFVLQYCLVLQTHTHTRIVRTYVHIFTFIHIYTCMYTYVVCTHIQINKYVYIYTYTHINICIYTYTHIHTYTR
jgi:hypothetical protein